MSLFTLCTDFLEFLAQVFHTTYYRMSVYFNIYFQGGILLLSALALLICSAVVTYQDSFQTKTNFLMVYAIVQMLFIAMAFYRYRPPLDSAYYRCFYDLLTISMHNMVIYALVNILIFIVFYLMLLISNIWLSYDVIK
jgi:hypothetical protein